MIENYSKKKVTSVALDQDENAVVKTDGIHEVIKGYLRWKELQTPGESIFGAHCDYRGQGVGKGKEGKWFCTVKGYGWDKELCVVGQCDKCTIREWLLKHNINAKTIQLCPKTTGLYKPELCKQCQETELQKYESCITRQYYEGDYGQAEGQEKAVQPAAPARGSPGLSSLEREEHKQNIKTKALEEQERKRTEATRQRAEIEIEKQKELSKLKQQAHRGSSYRPKVDWGNSAGYDSSASLPGEW